MDPSFAGLEALAEGDARWLASRWALASRAELEARFGADVASPLVALGSRFGALGDGVDVGTDLADVPPPLVVAWARSAAGSPSLRPLVALRAIAPRVTGATKRELRLALVDRVRSGPPIDRLHAYVELDAMEAKELRQDPSALASFELALEYASDHAITDAVFGRHLRERRRAFETCVAERACGSLASMRVAASALEVAATAGKRDRAADEARRLAIASKLVTHPDRAVWAPASRAIGRMAAESFGARSVIESWLDGERPTLRRRALLALACIPPTSETATSDPGARVLALVETSDDPWLVAMLGLALPTLATSHPGVLAWAIRALGRDDTSAEVRWSLTQGLLVASRVVAPGTFRAIGAEVLGRVRARLEAGHVGTEAQVLERTAADAAVLAGERGAPALDHVVAGLVHESLTRDRVSAASKAAKVERSALEAVHRGLEGASGAGELARARAEILAEDSARLLSRGTLTRLRRSADPAIAPPDLAPVELAERALGLALEAKDFARERMALRVVAALAEGDVDDAPDGLVVGRVLRAIVRARREPRHAKTLKRQSRSLAEVASRLVESVRAPGVLEATAPMLALAAYSALTAGDAGAVLALADLDDSIDTARLAWIEGATRDIASALSGAGAPLAPLLVPFGVTDGPLLRVVRDLDALRTWVSAQTGFARSTELQEKREDARDLVSIAWRVARDPVYALRGIEALGSSSDEFDGGPLVDAVRRVGAELDAIRAIRASDRPRLGSYEIVEKLGEGGMGVTWLVQHVGTKRHFVMKTARDDFDDGDRRSLAQGLLAMEARTACPIHHANLVAIVDADRTGAGEYVIFEYLVGCTLDAYTEARTLSLAELKSVARQVGAGLRAMHEHGFVHLDVKPENVMLQLDLAPQTLPFRFEPSSHRSVPFSRAVVIDLGISRRSHVAQEIVAGTIEYMAPEQLELLARLGPPADVYAFAATLYRAVTGASFFDLPSAATVDLVSAKKRVAPFEDEATRARLSGELAGLAPVLESATRTEPAERCTLEALVRGIDAL